MSDTGPTTPPSPPSGTEAPSPFMTGQQPVPEDDARFEAAVEDFFGQRPKTEGEGTPPTPEGEQQPEDAGGDTGGDTPEGEGQETVAGQASTAEVGGGEGSEQGSPSQQTKETAADFAILYEARYGHPPTAAELEGLFSLAEWASSLTPEHQQAINAALMGIQSQQQPTPQPQPEPAVPDDLKEAIEGDPVLEAIFNRVEETRRSVEQMAQSSVQDQQQRILRGLEDGMTRFKDQYKVSDPELQALQGALGSQRLLPGFVNAYGDPAEAMAKGLEYLYWNTPVFREREIQQRMEAAKETETQHETRKRKASSVTGTGGNGASRTTAPPTTPEGRYAALAKELAEAMNDGQG